MFIRSWAGVTLALATRIVRADDRTRGQLDAAYLHDGGAVPDAVTIAVIGRLW